MNFTYYIFIVFYVIRCTKNTFADIPVFEIHLENLLKMQQGLGWPHTLNVAEGHEALLKLGSSLQNPQNCTVTTPSGLTFDIANPPSNRYERWSAECGVRIKHVVKTDEGRWRLTAFRGSDSIAGWTEVLIEKDTSSYTAPDISLQDGQTHTDVVLTSLNNSYCLVAQPFSDSSLVPGHCHVTLERATRAVQGNWTILLGLPGRVQELHLERRVAVQAERLDVGYVHDSNANKIHLYCNIQHTEKNITFCRFQKTTSTSGFNVMDGLSDGSHSYYGEGFLKRHCGITIENPTSEDYGTWRCSVGVQQWVGTAVVQQTPMQALISVASYPSYRRINRDLRTDTEEESRTIFVQEDQSFLIMCRATVSLTYCWFQHPNGSQFTPVPIVNEDQPFWYTGQSLQTGDCGITFSHAFKEEEGEWTCHLGPSDQLGVEVTDRVYVRVTGPLAANRKDLEVTLGGNATLYCHSSNGNRALNYCRFLSPRFVGLNLDTFVTEANAIFGRYYFTPGKNLNYGDCSLTIIDIQAEDIGEWTCAALINEDSVESRDTILLLLDVSSINTRRVHAGIVGMSVGLLVLVVALAGFISYKKLGWPRFRRRQSTPSQTELFSMDRESNEARSSAGSSSDGSTIIDRNTPSVL